MAERNFSSKILDNLEKIHKNEFSFDQNEKAVVKTSDTTNYGDLRSNLISDNTSSYIVDSMLIRGVSVNRDENDCNYDYHLEKANEN